MSVTADPSVKDPSRDPEDTETPDKKDLVSYETHQRLLNEKKKIQARNQELEAAEKKRQEEALLAEGKLKEAIDATKKELNDALARLKERDERDVQAKKVAAVYKGLGSVDDKWLAIIGQHIDEVVVGDDGTVDQASVSKVVDGLKKSWPEMVKRTDPKLPNGQPPGQPSTITRSEWMKLSSKEMLKWRSDQIVG